MSSNQRLVFSFVVLLLAVLEINGQQSVFRIDNKFPQCRNSPSIAAKEQCMKQNCRGQSSVFECKALDCKLKFPTTEEGELNNKLKRLRCVKNICKSHPNHLTCQGLEECKKLKNQSFARAKFIICISKLFPKDDLEKATY